MFGVLLKRRTYLVKTSRKLAVLIDSCRNLTGRRLIFHEFGDPLKVLQLETFQVPDTIVDDQVLVQVLAAPVHPGDLNFIQGTYGRKPNLPAIPGSECSAIVLKIGDGVKDVNVGDHVQPKLNLWSTWSSHTVCHQNDLRKIPSDLPLAVAATIVANPTSAYRMLMDFTELKEGDFVIQNGANSAVGQAVIQICRDKGFRTINVIRDRPEVESVKKTLRELGADIVITPKELRTLNPRDATSSSGLPKLGLNCVGGDIASDTMRLLANGGTLVTYGGMSLKPLAVSNGALIFRDISVRGFWLSAWISRFSGTDRENEMMNYLFALAREKKFTPPEHQFVPLDQYKSALTNTITPFNTVKQILQM